MVRLRRGGASRVKITEIFSFPLHALFLSHPAKTCQFRLNQRPDLTFYTLHVLFTFIGGHPKQFYVEGRVALTKRMNIQENYKGWGSKGRLELFRKFIRFGVATRPLTGHHRNR